MDKRAATRARIVAAADRLFYEQGFEHTSFTAIAEAVGISRGNFYYHFRTKDDILAAVIEARAAETRAMLEQWAAEAPSPQERIRRFVRIVVANGDDIQRFGCPVGTLTAELAKLRHPSRPDAVAVFTLFRTWLGKQFTELDPTADADALALHVLAGSQGIAMLSNAFGDEAFVRREVARLDAWLDSQVTANR
ncbi:TetR/AcrR family transcriptional regulator [Dactylosporangium aurantiacum]|uniref:TetR/AcrR family transcriptional regulator n=1 Tax=Dactylosporangium aurantiacum TaxID=35754 RepID=A0A9Q9MMY6_9ACTN|nr:TetR/AcrR family transcriptional regulator [Dactylosporangium aurantiacum]MDG6110443.1 TetR/AcrR family transcriptional regulator [Dactylosporangium aurantiacum]UWZ58676.1 TetR/AcrR family transcriptional regulator [Dactylosporangium aurantiacum]